MLQGLKDAIRQEIQGNTVVESMVDNMDTDLRDSILDDMGISDDLLDAELEDDPEMKAFLDKIPEYDEEKDMEKKLKHVVENYLPELNV